MAATEAARGEPHVGKAIPQLGSERLVQGRGSYIADMHLHGERHVAILRSDQPHARLTALDVSAALALPGVELVVTGKDVFATTERLRSVWNFPGQRYADTRCLAHEVVRYVGEPVAAVVASDPYVAEDALEQITVEYEPLPTVTTAAEALAPGAPRLHEDWPDNVVGRVGWDVGAAAEALDAADLVIEERFEIQRVLALPLEGRGVLVAPDPTGPSLTVWTSTQSIHQVRSGLAGALGLPENRIRVVCPDVGGAFGCKATVYAEEVLLAFLALRLGRPVRWIEDRRESFVATAHARECTVELAIGFRGDGTIAGLRGRVVLDCGAIPSPAGLGSAWVTGAFLPGPYGVADIEIEALGVVTNKTPAGAYRGFGQPEANFALERTLDLAAARLGIDPADIRRRNLPASDELPRPTATGLLLDSGDYRRLLDRTLERFGWDAIGEEIDAARAEGRLLGAGLAFFVESTNFAPSPVTAFLGIAEPGFDTSVVRVEPSGHVRLITSQTPMGQGVETALAQVCADALLISIDDVAVAAGDTLASPFTGYGSGGSRAAGVGGSSVLLAARRVEEKMRRLAAHLLEVGEDDIDRVPEGFAVRGAPTRVLGFREVAHAAYTAASLPEGMEPGLEITHAYDPPGLAFSYGVAAVLLEIDAEIGAVELRRIVFGHDCGPQLNPALVEGQIRGGVTQAIGATLSEALEYSPDGQPLVTSLHHYLIPTANDVPELALVHLETPSPFSANGVKGVGESGAIPTPAAIVNALQQALPADAEPLRATPVRPEALLTAIEGAADGS